MSRPRSIALVAPPWYSVPPSGYGGIEAVVAELADELVRRGHDVVLVGVGESGTSGDVHCTYDAPQYERLGSADVEVAHAASTREILKDLDVDIVHDHTLAGPLLAPERYAPTVVTVHGPVTPDLHRAYSALQPTIRLVAISQSQRDEAATLRWAGMVHNPLSVGRFPFSADKDDYLLFLGRATPDKGAHLAIDAARAAGRRLIIGMKCNEPAEHEYFAAEVEPRLGDDIEYLGEVNGEDKLQLLARASCLVFPLQWSEPFGMVPIEAMATGTPVVAFARGALPETVVDGVTGVLVDEPHELPDAIARALQLDPHACRRHVDRNFSAGRAAAAYERIYEDALSANVTARSFRPSSRRSTAVPAAGR